MYKLSILPKSIHICLHKIKHCSQFLSLLVRIEEMFFIAERTTKDTIFVIWHQENSGIIAFFCFPQKSHTIITIKNYSNSYLFLELMALKYAFQTWNNSSNYAEFDSLHASLNGHKYLDNICPFLHVKFVSDLEVNDHIAANFRRVSIGPIYILFNIETQAAKIAYNCPPGSIESKIGIDVCLASSTSKGGANFNTSYLAICKWRNPQSYRKRCLSRQVM